MEGIMDNRRPGEGRNAAALTDRLVQKQGPPQGTPAPVPVTQGRSKKRNRRSRAQGKAAKQGGAEKSDDLPRKPQSSDRKAFLPNCNGQSGQKAVSQGDKTTMKMSEQNARPSNVARQQGGHNFKGPQKTAVRPTDHTKGRGNGRPLDSSPEHPKVHASKPFMGSTTLQDGSDRHGDISATDFYHHINEQHQLARSQNAMFTLAMADVHIHNEIVHANMRKNLPSADQAMINGFAHCDMAVDRLLKGTRAKDIHWAAQLQHQREEFEHIIAAEKAVSERLLSQSHRELVRWQERCERLEQGVQISRPREGPP